MRAATQPRAVRTRYPPPFFQSRFRTLIAHRCDNVEQTLMEYGCLVLHHSGILLLPRRSLHGLRLAHRHRTSSCVTVGVQFQSTWAR